MRVRPAEWKDLPSLLILGRLMQQESVTRYPAVEPQEVYNSLALTLAQPDRLLILIAEDDTGAVGFLSAFISKYSFSRELCAIHDVFFVAPARRGSSAASRLVDGFHAWAKVWGCRKTMIAVHTAVRPEITARFYEKKGYRRMGGVFDRDFV